MEEKRKYQYWLRCIPKIGNKKQKKLVEYCGSAKAVYELSKRQLLEVDGIQERDAQAVLESKGQWDLEKEAEIFIRTGVSMVTLEDREFPKKLKDLPDGPYALFYKGRLPQQKSKTAAIVGARRCSSYGRAVALNLGEALASRGVSVISGMAAGIDSFGHWGAIRGGGNTYAVLGCGVDICYPKGARELYERIPIFGAVLSEYLPGTIPTPGQFPARNRLISGLADVVIVVEAKQRSGSLITADFALEQGKEIYAAPGRIDDALSAGCNELIRQGAGIVTSVDDLLCELELCTKIGIADEEEKEREKIENALEKEELMVYSCFGLCARNMEDLLQMTKIPASELADLLVRLQTKGWIEEFYKNHYRKK